MFRKNIWKIVCIALLFYTVGAGLLLEVPRLNILNETIRNLYFHVPMWFGMTFLLINSLVYSIKYINNPLPKYDKWAVESVNMALVFGFLGIFTGMLWAKFTWGSFWSNDPKQNGAAIGILIYLAYMLLRSSLEDEQRRARISGIYNIFAFTAYFPIIFILPRLVSSLHPGAEGNPAFGAYDLDNQMRMVFYPAVIGWAMLGFWITELRVRLGNLGDRLLDLDGTSSTQQVD